MREKKSEGTANPAAFPGSFRRSDHQLPLSMVRPVHIPLLSLALATKTPPTILGLFVSAQNGLQGPPWRHQEGYL